MSLTQVEAEPKMVFLCYFQNCLLCTWSSTIIIIKSDDFYFNSLLSRSDPTNTTLCTHFVHGLV